MDKVRLQRILKDLLNLVNTVINDLDRMGASNDRQILKIVANNIMVLLNELSKES